jgi:hypothetical protein
MQDTSLKHQQAEPASNSQPQCLNLGVLILFNLDLLDTADYTVGALKLFPTHYMNGSLENDNELTSNKLLRLYYPTYTGSHII